MDLTLGEYTVLGLLAFGERSGYDLGNFAERSVSLIWKPAARHVYNVLPRLVSYGLATVRDVPQEGRPDKRVYRITAQGKRALAEWLERDEPGGPSERSVFLLKIFFGGFTSPEVVAEHVRRYREELAATAGIYEETEQRIAGKPENRFQYLTLKFGLERLEASMRWADEALKELESAARTS
jgi:PadR family transcriptional regulator AphA